MSMEITPSYLADTVFEDCMHETFAEDIIRSLRPFMEQYIVQVREYVYESLVSGFDRTMIQNSIPLIVSEIGGLVNMAEDALARSSSPRTVLLLNELRALKGHLGVFIKALEKNITEKPVIDRQMFLDDISARRIK